MLVCLNFLFKIFSQFKVYNKIIPKDAYFDNFFRRDTQLDENDSFYSKLKQIKIKFFEKKLKVLKKFRKKKKKNFFQTI